MMAFKGKRLFNGSRYGTQGFWAINDDSRNMQASWD
jgi:hypothetical protein